MAWQKHGITGEVRPHTYVMRTLTPQGTYKYIYAEDLMSGAKAEKTDRKDLLKALFLKVCKKTYGQEGVKVGQRYLNGMSLAHKQYKSMREIARMIRKKLPQDYLNQFEDLITEINKNYERPDLDRESKPKKLRGADTHGEDTERERSAEHIQEESGTAESAEDSRGKKDRILKAEAVRS